MDAFEKHIKNIFEEHQAPVDVDELWQKVEPSLNKKTRRKWWPFLLLLGASLVTGVFLIVDHDQDLSAGTHAMVSKDTSYFGKKGQLIKTKPVDNLIFTKENIQSDVAMQTKPALTDVNSRVPSQKLKWFDSSISNTVDENDELAGSEQHSVFTGSDQNPGITAISTPKVDLSALVRPVILLNSFPQMPETAVKANFARVKLSLDLFAGMDHSKKFLAAKSLDDTWYAEKRKATELPLESYHIGAHLNATHTSGFFAGAGVVYYRTTELFESKDRVMVEKITDDIVEIITYADGSIEERSGSKIILEPKSWEKKKYNAYHYIDLPVYLGYAFPVRRSLLEIYSGLSFNLLFDQKGEIIGQKGLPVNLENPDDTIFKKLVPASGILGFNALFPVNEHWVVFVSPVVHVNLGSITGSGYPLEQKYLKSGLRLGSRLRF